MTMTGRFRPNEAQRAAIEFGIDSPLKVVAGAGAGKTQVLTYRFIHLVEKHRLRPNRILALTFTKKAAAEMQARISGALIEKGLIGRSEAPLLLWIGNFHSICGRLLRQNSLMAGLDPSCEVVDEAEQRGFFAEVVNEFLEKQLCAETNPDSFEELMISRTSEFVDDMLRVINRLKGNFITPAEVKRPLGDRLSEHYRFIERVLDETVADTGLHHSTRGAAERRRTTLRSAEAHERLALDAVYEIYAAYQKKLESQDLLDFNDLVYHAYRLVESDPSMKRRFRYILVDEFQDTDHGQYKLLQALSDNFKNVTVVADKKQSIYEWREARLENIDNFPGEIIALQENYRSFGEILDSANYFIRDSMPGEHPIRPALKGGRGRAGSPSVRLFRADSAEAEAEYVALEVSHLLRTREPGDIAILMRSVRSSRPYEDALAAGGIKFATVGGCGFYDLSETKDLLALLKVISDPFDDLSMARALQSGIVGLSDASLYAICRGRNKGEGIYDALKHPDKVTALRPRARERLRWLIGIIEELANARGSLTLGELFSRALERTDYLKYLSFLEGPRGARFSNVATFYKMTATFEERHPGAGVEEFLEYLENSIANEVGAAPTGFSADSVQIMTVHQAKGLEFPVVFVVNLTDGSFPLRFRPDNFGCDERYGFYARKTAGGEVTVRYRGGYGGSIEEHLKDRHFFEESRIMYVAMTRARDLLYLTTSSGEDGERNFFRRMEQFACDGNGETCIQLVDSLPAHPVTPEPGPEAPMEMDIETIKEFAEHAVRRLSAMAPVERDQEGVIRLSYSRLALFRRCPMKYALRYVYNLPLAPHEEAQEDGHPTNVDTYTLGNLLHETLMQFHRGRRTGASVDAYDVFKTAAVGCPEKLLRAGEKLLGNYLASPLSRHETLYEEKEFHWKIENAPRVIMLEGKIDHIHREGRRLKIVDYKVGAPDPDTHALQLGIYRLAMEAVLDERGVLTSNFYLSTGEEAPREFSEEELLHIRDGIIRDALKISGADFGMDAAGRRADDCARCEYHSFCPSR